MLLRKSRGADAYCAASALTDEEQEMTLEQFMEKVEQKNTKDCGKMESSIWIIWLF